MTGIRKAFSRSFGYAYQTCEIIWYDIEGNSLLQRTRLLVKVLKNFWLLSYPLTWGYSQALSIMWILIILSLNRLGQMHKMMCNYTLGKENKPRWLNINGCNPGFLQTSWNTSATNHWWLTRSGESSRRTGQMSKET